VFSVDLDEKGTLKLPYNVTEDPWFAAQKFIHKHELSQMFLDQVAKFIIDNTKGVEIGTAASSSDYVDPFTGGNRYVPGSSGSNHAQVSGGGGGGLDPFTGSGAYTTSSASRATSSTVELNNASSGPCFPVKDFVRFSSPPNYDALTKKLKEIIGDLGPEAGFGEEGINTLLDIGRNAVWNENVNLYVKTCLVNWPAGTY
jgi:phospholipase A-2-activating protein